MLNLMAFMVAGEQSIFIFRLMPFPLVYLTMCYASYEVKADCLSVDDSGRPIKTSDNLPVPDRPSYDIVITGSRELCEGNSPDEFAVQLLRRIQDHLRHHVTGI